MFWFGHPTVLSNDGVTTTFELDALGRRLASEVVVTTPAGSRTLRTVFERDAAGRLVSVLDGWRGDETTLYAVYPSRRFVVPKVRAFIEFLQGAFA